MSSKSLMPQINFHAMPASFLLSIVQVPAFEANQKYLIWQTRKSKHSYIWQHYPLLPEGEFKDYYRRKVAEGKNKMSVINAIRNKLVHRIFAVIKRSSP